MNEHFETQAEAILESLGRVLGLPGLEFDNEDDTCLLVLDQKIEIAITLNAENNELIIHHQIGTLAENNRYYVVEQLLEANLFWAGTRGATISMERSSGIVMIAKTVGLRDQEGLLINGEVLATDIVNLAEVATHWARLLNDQAPTKLSSEQPINLMTSQMIA